MAKKNQRSVEYYSDPQYVDNLFIRFFKNMFTLENMSALVVAILCMSGPPFYYAWMKKASIPNGFYAVTLIPVIGCFILCSIRMTKIVNDKVKLSKKQHSLVHLIRDFYGDSLQKISEKKKENQLELVCDKICAETESIFKHIKSTDDIGTAIRLATEIDGKKIVFKTFGRSGLNPNRKVTSEPIPFSTGLPAFLNNRSCSGCLIYNDIFAAASQNAFHLTANERDGYEKDVVSLMALPINSVEGGTKKMIGILYITSPQKSFFNACDVGFAKSIADVVAIVIAQKQFEATMVEKRG